LHLPHLDPACLPFGDSRYRKCLVCPQRTILHYPSQKPVSRSRPMAKRKASEDGGPPSAKRPAFDLSGDQPSSNSTNIKRTSYRQTKLAFGSGSASSQLHCIASPHQLSTVLSDLSLNPRYRKVNVHKAYNDWHQDLTIGARTVIEAIERGTPITKQLLLSIGSLSRNVRTADWYMCIVEDANDDAYFRAYVGQSEDVGSRMKQHCDLCSKDPTETPAANKLLYHVWRKEARQATFVHLGEQRNFIKGDTASHLQLNIGEQILAEKFQTLQHPTLRRILPHQATQMPAFGLNVSLPIHQPFQSSVPSERDDSDSALEFALLDKASDPELRDYYQKNRHQFTTEQQQKGRHTMAQSQHVQQIHGARQGKQAKTSNLMRDPQSEAEKVVKVICMKCRSAASLHVDPAPQYEIATNGYVARRAPCTTCPRSASTPTKRAREIMIPADGNAFVRWDWVGKNKNREDIRWAHKR
jgi:predicted GIY-YIG superfamily endonuclease